MFPRWPSKNIFLEMRNVRFETSGASDLQFPQQSDFHQFRPKSLERYRSDLGQEQRVSPRLDHPFDLRLHTPARTSSDRRNLLFHLHVDGDRRLPSRLPLGHPLLGSGNVLLGFDRFGLTDAVFPLVWNFGREAGELLAQDLLFLRDRGEPGRRKEARTTRSSSVSSSF